VVKTDTSISEQQMKLYYESLSEKDRRRYAAIEAQKIGYGGIQYISQLFKCNYRTLIPQVGRENLVFLKNGKF
jgi:hypothetical protein